ncbi:hypothetical protein T484DRAFT_3650117 [Baffinella frigidus]|nr:hypothetical protein T484DRAFT_3650117 [Cryptophyta sp. CCMP2293]
MPDLSAAPTQPTTRFFIRLVVGEDAVLPELPLQVPPSLRPEIVEETGVCFLPVLGLRETGVVLEDLHPLHRELVLHQRAFVEADGHVFVVLLPLLLRDAQERERERERERARKREAALPLENEARLWLAAAVRALHRLAEAHREAQAGKLVGACQCRYHWPCVQGAKVEGSLPGLGFRVCGSQFRTEGSGFRVQGSGFRVQGLGVNRRYEQEQLTTLTRPDSTVLSGIFGDEYLCFIAARAISMFSLNFFDFFCLKS